MRTGPTAMVWFASLLGCAQLPALGTGTTGSHGTASTTGQTSAAAGSSGASSSSGRSASTGGSSSGSLVPEPTPLPSYPVFGAAIAVDRTTLYVAAAGAGILTYSIADGGFLGLLNPDGLHVDALTYEPISGQIWYGSADAGFGVAAPLSDGGCGAAQLETAALAPAGPGAVQAVGAWGWEECDTTGPLAGTWQQFPDPSYGSNPLAAQALTLAPVGGALVPFFGAYGTPITCANLDAGALEPLYSPTNFTSLLGMASGNTDAGPTVFWVDDAAVWAFRACCTQGCAAATTVSNLPDQTYPRPEALAVDPDGLTLYMANFADGLIETMPLASVVF